MGKKFIRTLVVVLTVFGTFLFVYPDDLWEYDTAYNQREILKESSKKLLNHRDQPVVYRSRFVALHNGIHSARSGGRMVSPPLISLSTCVLRC